MENFCPPLAFTLRCRGAFFYKAAVADSLQVFFCSVGDLDPQDLYVFGAPGSGSISQRNGSGSFPILINVSSELKKCLQIKILTQNFKN